MDKKINPCLNQKLPNKHWLGRRTNQVVVTYKASIMLSTGSIYFVTWVAHYIKRFCNVFCAYVKIVTNYHGQHD